MKAIKHNNNGKDGKEKKKDTNYANHTSYYAFQSKYVMNGKHKLVATNSPENDISSKFLLDHSDNYELPSIKLTSAPKMLSVLVNDNNKKKVPSIISLKRKGDSVLVSRPESPSKKLSELVYGNNKKPSIISLKNNENHLQDETNSNQLSSFKLNTVKSTEQSKLPESNDDIKGCSFLSLKLKNDQSATKKLLKLMHNKDLHTSVNRITDESSRKPESNELEDFITLNETIKPSPRDSISSNKSDYSPSKKLSYLVNKSCNSERKLSVKSEASISLIKIEDKPCSNEKSVLPTTNKMKNKIEKNDLFNDQKVDVKLDSMEDCIIDVFSDNLKVDAKVGFSDHCKVDTKLESFYNLEPKVENTITVVKKEEASINVSEILKNSFLSRGKLKEVVNDTSVVCVGNVDPKSWKITVNKSQQGNTLDSLRSVGHKHNNKIQITSDKIVSSITNRPETVDIFWENPVIGLGNKTGIPSLLSKENKTLKIFDKVYSSCTFTRDMLKTVRVIGPVDNKFIACTIMSEKFQSWMLVLIDQHAAHERIRLEKLLKQVGYYTKEKKKISGNSTVLLPPATISLNENDLGLLIHYKKEFSNVGLHFSSVKKSSNNVFVSSVPAIFVSGSELKLKAKGTVLNTDFLKEFILEQISYMKSTGCSCNTSSRSIFKALASYACHGAIKFGDRISLATCKSIMIDLAVCDLPFQCAHGRPTIAPIFQLDFLDEMLKKKLSPPRLENINLSN